MDKLITKDRRKTIATIRLPALRLKALNAIQETRGDKIVTALNLAFLTVILILILYPLVYTVSASFSSPSAVISGKVTLFPVDFTLIGYQKLFAYPILIKGLLNSLFYTLLGSSL